MSDEDGLASELASLRIDREPKRRAATSSNRLVTSAVVVVVVLLLGAAGLLFFRRAEGSLFPEEVELGAVTLISPAHADVTLVATGYVYARKRATVAPKIIGRIARVLVDEGDRVKQNQVVAELDAGEAQAQLEQVRGDVVAAEAKVMRARADLSDAEVKLEREERLLPANATTRAAHEDAGARAESARAQLKAAQADVLAARARHSAAAVPLENTPVRAPFTGTVVHKMAEVGEVIALTGSSGKYGGFSIVELDELAVQADVSEAQLSKVKVGTPAEIILDAFPDRRFRARVREIRPMVDRAKAAVTVTGGFEGAAAALLPDQAAEA